MAHPVEHGRYAAFISYSHKDALFGRWLHRRLESYRLPRRLAGSEGERGPVPARLTPIFRDREELPAAGDLSERVRAALASSDSLIVVCSPDAAASPWVAMEITTFRALHPDLPIFAAIVDGEPACCFPPDIKAGAGGAVEPLAADFRPGADGRRLGLLKLVAGVSGVGLDQLVQRDAQRRIRRVTAVTLAAIAGMVITALLAIFAFNARAEAQRQRREAEGLVEFMLTDLRDRLKGVGRLDVLTSVNQRALGYYQHQDIGRLPPDSLERRARILHAMGEDDESRGNLDRALAEFREASRTTSALLAAKPDDPERIYDHAQSEYWVGLVAWHRKQFGSAERAFRNYAAGAEKLVRRDPRNIDWLRELAYAQSNLGTLFLRDYRDAAAAEMLFEGARAKFQRAAMLRPADTGIEVDLADAYAWLADSQREQGQMEKAWSQRQAQLAILRRLRDSDPLNAVFRQDIVGNAIGLAQIEIDRRQYAQARQRLDAALAESARLCKLDAANSRSKAQSQLIRLLLAKTVLLDTRGPVLRGPTLRLIGGCSTGDSELDSFCRALRRPLQTAVDTGQSSDIWEDDHEDHRLTTRWGLDLRRERKLAAEAIMERRIQ